MNSWASCCSGELVRSSKSLTSANGLDPSRSVMLSSAEKLLFWTESSILHSSIIKWIARDRDECQRSVGIYFLPMLYLTFISTKLWICERGIIHYDTCGIKSYFKARHVYNTPERIASAINVVLLITTYDLLIMTYVSHVKKSYTN